MTAIDARARIPVGRKWVAVRRALRSGWRQGARMVSAGRTRFQRPALTIGGFGCFSAAGFQANTAVGLVVTGISLLTFEWLSSSGDA